jgi:hypothetical protein
LLAGLRVHRRNEALRAGTRLPGLGGGTPAVRARRGTPLRGLPPAGGLLGGTPLGGLGPPADAVSGERGPSGGYLGPATPLDLATLLALRLPLRPGIRALRPGQRFRARLHAPGVRYRTPGWLDIGTFRTQFGRPRLRRPAFTRQAGAVVPLPLVHLKSVTAWSPNRNALTRLLGHAGQVSSVHTMRTEKSLVGKARPMPSPRVIHRLCTRRRTGTGGMSTGCPKARPPARLGSDVRLRMVGEPHA